MNNQEYTPAAMAKRLAAELRNYMAENSIPQSDLGIADNCPIKSSTFGNMTRGQCSYSTMVKVCGFLDLPEPEIKYTWQV